MPLRKPTGAPVVVTLTPIAVARDSRTFKQAASMSRLGFSSIVVEGMPSSLDRTALPFELRYGGRGAATAASRHGSHLDEPAAAARAAAPATGTPGSRFGAPGRAFWALAAMLRRTPAPLRARLRPVYRWTVGAVWFATYLTGYARAYVAGPLRAMPRASLYYLHGFYQFPAVYLVSRWRGVPFVYDAHDFYSRIHGLEKNAHPWRRWAYRFEAWLERLAARRAAAVVTVSDGLAAEMHAAFGRRPVVLRNTQDARLERAPAQSLRDRLALGSDAFLVVVIGQAKPGLAMRQVCEAVAELPKTHVVFLGAGYDDARCDLTSPSGAGRVHTLPPVAPAEVVPFVRSADAALLPYIPLSVNYENALPNGLFSALSAGLPVLYPRLPEISRLAERYTFGLEVDALDARSMRDALAALAADGALRDRLRSGARTAARDLSWEADERVLAALIDRVLGRDVPASGIGSAGVATPAA